LFLNCIYFSHPLVIILRRPSQWAKPKHFKNTGLRCCRCRFRAVNTRHSGRTRTGVALSVSWPLTFTTRWARARWDLPRTRTPWSTQSWGCVVSKGSGWWTRPSCRSYRAVTPTRWRSWLARKRPTWSRKTGSNDRTGRATLLPMWTAHIIYYATVGPNHIISPYYVVTVLKSI